MSNSVDLGSVTLSFSQLTLVGYLGLQLGVLLLVLICTKSTLKEIFQRHSTYQSAIVHAFDMGSDLAVMVEFYFLGTDGSSSSEYYNPLKLCYAMFFVHLMYRTLSTIQIYISTKKLRSSTSEAAFNACLQFFDVLVFKEVFVAFREKRTQATVTMLQVKRLEATLESACQIFIQFTYFFKTTYDQSGIQTSDILVIVSLLFSITSVANIITKSDDFSFVGRDDDDEERKWFLFLFRRRFPPSGPFITRLFFRFCEILGRIVLVSLFWILTNGTVVVIALCSELLFYFILYMNGIIGHNWLYIVSFVTFHPNLSISIDISKMTDSKLYKLLYCGISYYSVKKSLNSMDGASMVNDSMFSSAVESKLTKIHHESNADMYMQQQRKAREDLAASKGVSLKERTKMFQENLQNDAQSPTNKPVTSDEKTHNDRKKNNSNLNAAIDLFNSGQVSNTSRYENPNEAIDSVPVLTPAAADNPTPSAAKEKNTKQDTTTPKKKGKKNKKDTQSKGKTANKEKANTNESKPNGSKKKVNKRANSETIGKNTTKGKPSGKSKKTNGKSGGKKEKNEKNEKIEKSDKEDEKDKEEDKSEEHVMKSGSVDIVIDNKNDLNDLNDLNDEKDQQMTQDSIQKSPSNIEMQLQMQIHMLSNESSVAHTKDNSVIVSMGTNVTNFGDGRGNLLIQVHYFHLLCKSLVYMFLINLIYIGKKTNGLDFNQILGFTLTYDEAFDFIDNTVMGKIVYAVSIIGPLIAFLLCTFYIGKVATQPDIITLAKYNWLEAIEDLIRNEPSKRTQYIHATDANGMHLFFIILMYPMEDNHRSYNDIIDMIDYLLLCGKGPKYINRFYNEHNAQAMVLIKRFAEYIIDLSFDPRVSSNANQSVKRAKTQLRLQRTVDVSDEENEEDEDEDGYQSPRELKNEFDNAGRDRQASHVLGVGKTKIDKDENLVVVPKYMVGYGVQSMLSSASTKKDLRNDLIFFLQNFRSKTGRMSVDDGCKFFQHFMTVLMNCYLLDNTSNKFSLISLSIDNYDENPVALAFRQLGIFLGPWNTSLGRHFYDSLLTEYNELFRTFFRLYIDFALKQMEAANKHENKDAIVAFYQSAIHSIITCFGVNILSSYFNTQYATSEAIIYFNELSGRYEVTTIKEFRTNKIVPSHNPKLEIKEELVKFGIAVHFDAEFTREVLEIEINPKLRNKVISTTFRASWEVTNTGEKEWGYDTAVALVSNPKYLTLVDGSVSNAAPNETIRIDCTFHLEIPKMGKKTTVYSDDLEYYIRIGKKVDPKLDNIRPFGTVGRFKLMVDGNGTKDLEICQGSDPNNASMDNDPANEATCAIM